MNKTLILLLVVLSVFAVGCSSQPEIVDDVTDTTQEIADEVTNSITDTTDEVVNATVNDTDFLTEEDESLGDLI